MQHNPTSMWRQPAKRLAGSIGIGAAAGAATAAGVIFGRKAVATAKTGQGHPLSSAHSTWRPALSSRNTRWTR
jgi:hypothetical protein